MQTKDAAAQSGLAAAGLSDQTESLPPLNMEAHIVHCLQELLPVKDGCFLHGEILF